MSNYHIISLIFSAILIIISVELYVLAFIGDLIAVNRKLIEDVQYRMKKMGNRKINSKKANKIRREKRQLKIFS